MNALVVRAIGHALDALLRGVTIRKMGAISEREIGFHLAGSGPPMLILSVEPGFPHARLAGAVPIRRRLTEQLGEAPGGLAGARFTAIAAVGLERVLAFEAEPRAGDPLTLYLELLPRTPFLVITAGGLVVAATRAPGTRRPDDRRMARGAPYELPFKLGPPTGRPPAAALLAEWIAAAPHPTPPDWAAAIAERWPAVEASFLAELLAGVATPEEAILRIEHYRGPLALDLGPPPVVTPGIPGRSADPAEDGAPPDSRDGAQAVLATVARYAELGRTSQTSGALRRDALRALQNESARLDRLRAGLDRDETGLGDPALLRRQGETLLAHLKEVARGARAITLPDPYGETPLSIPLDPRRSPSANAEALFAAARRVERAVERLAARRSELATEAERLTRAAAEIQSAPEDALRSVCERWVKEGLLAAELLAAPEGVGKERARSGPEPRLPYRKYALAGGWEIWVGRSAADNDILTHELARPHDLWFHAHGASGSHVLLRRADGSRAQPPPAAVEAAAACAAFFSGARHSRMVPVIVTEKRYVRKPRRSPPGTAVCLREKTVMAVPAAPAAPD